MQVLLLSLTLICLLNAQTNLKPPGASVDQPLPFSHKKHSELGLTCKTCHRNADPGESMGIAPASSCMGCHKTALADSPAIQRLAKYAEQKADPAWVRVYLIPSYVFFSHRRHLEAGANCQTCHGPVATQNQLRRESDISMGGCMDCHIRNRARNDCNYCHEPR